VISRITNKLRVIAVNSSSNPIVYVMSYEETSSIAEIAVERDLIVICDEVCEKP